LSIKKHHLMPRIDIVHHLVYRYYLPETLGTAEPPMCRDNLPMRQLAVQPKVDKNSASAPDRGPGPTSSSIQSSHSRSNIL
jgi:hypothetical protein